MVFLMKARTTTAINSQIRVNLARISAGSA